MRAWSLAMCTLVLAGCGAVELGVGDRTQAQVLWIGDGDSLRARVGGAERDLRLWGIDAPEQGQAAAEASRAALRALIDHRRVSIEVVAVDDYDRLVVRMERDGASVNRAQIAAGHAWWFRRYAPEATDYRDAETDARAQRRGLWAAPEPEAPWAYRERTREP